MFDREVMGVFDVMVTAADKGGKEVCSLRVILYCHINLDERPTDNHNW